MIADLDETIRKLLTQEMPIKNGEIDVAFDQPKREWSARLSKPTINFFLYDVRENVTLRQAQVERLANNARNNDIAMFKRTPFRVDCAYMVTAWAADPQDEHRLLSRCMLALFRNPVIPQELLVGSMKNQPFDLQANLGQNDRLKNPAELWSAMDNEMRPSVPYAITIALDPWMAVSGTIVRTLILKPGQAPYRPRDRRITEDGGDAAMTYIGGTVRQKTADGIPVPGIDVAIKGTGLISRTDFEGHFVLGSLQPGFYTLVAWLPDQKVKQREISVPAKDGNYDLIV